MKDTEYHQMRLLSALLAALLVTATVSAVVAPAAAQTDESVSGEISAAIESAAGVAERAIPVNLLRNPDDFVRGLQARWFEKPDDNTAAEAERGVRTYINNNSSDFVTWADGRYNASQNLAVAEIVYEVDGETASHYIVTTASNDTYDSLAVTNTTDRTVDYTCTLEASAAKNAPREVRDIHQEFVVANENISGEYKAEMAAKYAREVSCERA